jgi:hypothetical protein
MKIVNRSFRLIALYAISIIALSCGSHESAGIPDSVDSVHHSRIDSLGHSYTFAPTPLWGDSSNESITPFVFNLRLSQNIPTLLGTVFSVLDNIYEHNASIILVEHSLGLHAIVDSTRSDVIKRVWKINIKEKKIELIRNDASTAELSWPYSIR